MLAWMLVAWWLATRDIVINAAHDVIAMLLSYLALRATQWFARTFQRVRRPYMSTSASYLCRWPAFLTLLLTLAGSANARNRRCRRRSCGRSHAKCPAPTHAGSASTPTGPRCGSGVAVARSRSSD